MNKWIKDKLGLEVTGKLEAILDRVADNLKEFHVSSIENERHLREFIMERVLDSGKRFLFVELPNGKAVPVAALPEDKQEEALEKIMMKILDTVEGQGALLRRMTAKIILDYRMWLRLKEMLPTLQVNSSQHKHVIKGIEHIENEIKEEMCFMDMWPMFGETRDVDYEEVRNNALRMIIENSLIGPEASKQR